MIVIEGPGPVYFIGYHGLGQFNTIDHEMNILVANGTRRLKLYANKIYNVCPVVTPAWSRRQGALHNWMTVENRIMRGFESP